jgi:putative transposase
MDFFADQLADGRKLRALTVVAVFTREALCIRVGQKLRGEDVVDACNRLVAKRGAPARVFVDNGSEFSGRLSLAVRASDAAPTPLAAPRS